MADLALNLDDDARETAAYGDLVFGPTGDLILTGQNDAIRQALILRLQSSVGDYFMAPADGVRWIDMLGSTTGYDDSFDAVLRNTVLGTPGINGLLAWNVTFNRSARVVTVAMECEAATGTINFSLPIGESGAL